MPISGYVAGGASEALEEVLDRRLKEQIRQQQEKEHADQVAIQRQQIDLQQRRDAAMDLERAEDRKWRQGERDIATAQRAEADTDPGAITPEIAAVLSKDPAIAGRISQRKVIDASPIAAQSVLPGTVTPQGAGDVSGPTLQTGDKPMPRQIDNLMPRGTAPTAMGGAVTAGVDASGPQQYPVLGATPAQAKAAELARTSRTYHDSLAGKPQSERQRIATEAAGRGIKIDPSLVEATEEEKRRTKEDDLAKMRKYEEGIWQNHFDQQQRATNDRASRDKPPTGLQQKMLDFHNRVLESNSVIDENESKLTATDVRLIATLPSFAPESVTAFIQNKGLSEAGKRYALALSTFSDPRLREASGAVISMGEYEGDRRMFARQPDDSPELAAQRKRIRKLVEEGLASKAGPAYDQYWGEKFVPTVRPGDQGKGGAGKGGGKPRVKVSIDKDGNVVETPIKD